MFNQVTLIGNLTRDPELRYSGSGTAICTIGLATNRSWKDKNTGEKQQEVCFIDVKFFGRSGEVVGQHFSRGKPIVVTGRIALDQWQDQNGQKRSKHYIVADTFNFLPKSQEGGQQQSSGDYTNRSYSSGTPKQNSDPIPDVSDDDIPF